MTLNHLTSLRLCYYRGQETLPPGAFSTTVLATGDVDVRRDLPSYNVYRHGVLTATVKDIVDLWQDDFVTFLLGCSFSFEEALEQVMCMCVHVYPRVVAWCMCVRLHARVRDLCLHP